MTWYEKIAQRNPDFTLENDGVIYIQRWWLIPRNRYFNVYLHKISGPDEPTLHDHEYMSLSYCLKGLLKERLSGDYRMIYTGDFIFRMPSTMHWLENISPVVWTIFITGPRVRTWGFRTPEGWQPHYLFKQRPNVKEY